MRKTKILSSAFVMTMVSFGAFGADKIITSANTCTVDVLGVSDNNATANTIATWDLIDYTLDPGQYLNVTETSVDKTTCPAGSYCVGGGYTVETADNSIAQCPTGYPNSANGASADTQCYTACTVATANIAHATAVSGNDYFGTGVDTCGATACETGYHVDGGGIELVEKDPLIPVDYTVGSNGDIAWIDANGILGNVNFPDANLTANNTWVSEFDYGRVYGKASCQSATNPVSVYDIMEKAEAVMSETMSMDEFKSYLEPMVGSVKALFMADVLSGVMNGSKSDTDMLETIWAVFMVEPNANYSTDSTGQYCYCQLDGFVPIGGEKEAVVSAPWILQSPNDFESASDCASGCAYYCGVYVKSEDVIGYLSRAALYGVLDLVESGGICAANTINIDWNPDNGGDHIKNMCTYEGSITVPSDPVKPGYTFMGWKLVE